MKSFLSRKTLASRVRSNGAKKRGNTLPNSAFLTHLVDKEPRSKQGEQEEDTRLRRRLKRCIPDDPKTALFFLVALAYLICSCVRFAYTGDAGMLTTLFQSVATYAGVSVVAPHIPWGKKKGIDQQGQK